MDQKPTFDLLKRRTASPPFHFTFALMYITITGVVAYLNSFTLCRNYILVEGDAGFGLGTLLILLLGLEWFERKRYDDTPPTGIAIILLVTRMIFFEGMIALDCTRTALFLYPVIPFSAYFAFGGRISWLLSLFYMALAVWRMGHIDSAWYTDPELISNILSFIFVMLLTPVTARIIRRDEQSRQRTEQLLNDLKVSNLQLRAYAEQAAELSAAEERNRLARDIHDSLGHHLTAVSIQLEKALAYQDRAPEVTTQAIRDAKQAATEALQNVRRSVSALRDSDGDFSLKTALSNLVNRLNNDYFSITFSITGDETGYSRPVLMTLYRTAQEGLTNIEKHAQASAVVLTITLGEEEASLLLRDDGQGFDTTTLDTAPTAQAPRFGLQGIRERLDSVRGHLALQSAPQRGTELAITIPKQLITNNPRI
ncbi:MAG: sensor histidine kinase [Anaerolineae bacterium]|nr:sensor histidine kinase [Anaerolineae bacterium]